MIYHPVVQKLDATAIELYEFEKTFSKSATILAGQVNHKLNQMGLRKYFDAQWCWALGHIGILYQMIRWFKLHDPEVQLILETQDQIANRYFLQALAPYITIITQVPEALREEAMYNAVYFGCPDGVNHIHDWLKIAEKACKDVHLLSLSEQDKLTTDSLLNQLGVKRPYVAVQARHMAYDPKRNVTEHQVFEALARYEGYSFVSTGLDSHPINAKLPSVLTLDNPRLASFLLSASCDQFIGSDSGAWTIPWSFNRPVELINDNTEAWIYG